MTGHQSRSVVALRATLSELAKAGKLDWSVVQTAMKELPIDANKLNPHTD